MSTAPTDLSADRSAGHLKISWSDQPTSELSFRLLRESCTCAKCVHEITGERLLDPASIPDDIHIEKMSLTGNYAVKILWSDGHDTGLYTWEKLRALKAEDAN